MIRKPLGAIGAVVILLVVGLAILAPVVAPYDPNRVDRHVLLQAPSSAHLLGTDEFGRDILSRLIYGSRVSIAVALGVALPAMIIGLVGGVISGYLGGVTDQLVQRILEIFLSLPLLVFAIAVVTALGSSLQNIVLALSLAVWPGLVRVVRASTLVTKQFAFVESARATGGSGLWIMRRHIAPNQLPVAIILVTSLVGNVILAEAALSFLGFGLRPPTASWGAMLSGRATEYTLTAPWLAIAPGLAITVVVFAFNFVGDALRDLLDVRLRGAG